MMQHSHHPPSPSGQAMHPVETGFGFAMVEMLEVSLPGMLCSKMRWRRLGGLKVVLAHRELKYDWLEGCSTD